MGVFATMFGNKKAVDTASDVVEKVSTGAVNGIDKLFYTQEEKEENAQERIRLASDLILKLQDQFTPRAITRRILAVTFSAVYCIVFLSSHIILMIDYLKGKLTGKETIKEIIELVNAFSIGYLIITIIIFYFGYYGVGKILEKKNGK